MSGLLDIYNSKRGSYSKTFTCPETGVELRMDKPRYRTRRTAEALAGALWREQSGGEVVLREYADLVRGVLIGLCLYQVGQTEPLGAQVLDLDERLIEHYDAILRSIENPPIENLDPELLDQMVEELRGKSERVVQHLNVSDGSMLAHLLRYMARQLSK